MTLVGFLGTTVPHGLPIAPGRTVTGSDAVRSPDVTETTTVPGL